MSARVAVPAQHSHSGSMAAPGKSILAVTNVIHHLGKPHLGKTQAQTGLGGWWGWNLSFLQLPPHELGTGEPPEVHLDISKWQEMSKVLSMPALPRCLKMCCVNSGAVSMCLKISGSIHSIWSLSSLVSTRLWEWNWPQNWWAAEGAFASAWRSPLA